MAPPVANHPYFVPHNPGTTGTVRDAGDDGFDVDEIPASINPDEFAPRIVNLVDNAQPTPLQRVRKQLSFVSDRSAKTNGVEETGADRNNHAKDNNYSQQQQQQQQEGPVKKAIEKIFTPRTHRETKYSVLNESAKKAAPKLFFAGERTFLQWMHTGVLLSAISLAISAHVETGSLGDWIALLLLPISIAIMVYSMRQFSKRTYMIASRSPGPYEDKWGPVFVGGVFSLSLLVQFFIVLAQQW